MSDVVGGAEIYDRASALAKRFAHEILEPEKASAAEVVTACTLVAVYTCLMANKDINIIADLAKEFAKNPLPLGAKR